MGNQLIENREVEAKIAKLNAETARINDLRSKDMEFLRIESDRIRHATKYDAWRVSFIIFAIVVTSFSAGICVGALLHPAIPFSNTFTN